MIVLNFGHPLTEPQIAAVKELYSVETVQVIDVKVQVDMNQPLAPQITALVDGIGITGEQYQTQPILVNLPGLAPAGAVLLAELHGRMGYFPPIIRMKQVAGPPPVFEVAEIVNLASVRNAARQKR